MNRKFIKETYHLPSAEEVKKMDAFQAEYIIQMQRQMMKDKKAPLTPEEVQSIRRDATTHICNMIPEWNSWDEDRQVTEIQKLKDYELAAALRHAVDGGQPVLFVLPDQVKVSLVTQLMADNLHRPVRDLLNMTNKYGERLFDVMPMGSPEMRRLGELFQDASHTNAFNRTVYAIRRIYGKSDGISARLKKTQKGVSVRKTRQKGGGR